MLGSKPFAEKNADERLIEVAQLFVILKEDDSTALATRRMVELLAIDYMERLTVAGEVS